MEAVLEVSSENISIKICIKYLMHNLLLTSWRTDRESDAVAGVFDQVDDVSVMKRVDVNMIHRQDSVSNLETSASFRRRS